MSRRLAAPALALISGALAAGCASRPPNPTLPRDVGWRSVVRIGGKGFVEVKTAFAARGDKWYFLREPDIIVVSDGEKVASNLQEDPDVLATFDLRRVFDSLYRALPDFQYLGEEEVDGRRAWHYAARVEDEEREVWVDAETQAPRRYRVVRPGTRVPVVDELFFDLPEGFVTPERFDTRAVEEGLRRAPALPEDAPGGD